MILHVVWCLIQSLLLFAVVVPLTLIGLFVVPLGLLRPDDSAKSTTTTTDGMYTWWLRRLPRWALWWDNPVDGFLGDDQFRWAGRDIPFGWSNTGLLAQFWWGAIRNPLHYFKSFIITCDVRRCRFYQLAGQAFVRDRPDATGFQLLLAKRDDGVRFYRLYWVWQWPGTERAAIVEIGHEFRADHWGQEYVGREYKALKGFAFLIHPCKKI